MKKKLMFCMTTSCALAFSDGFAPVDYAPLEEFAEDAKFISFADEATDLDLLADKEYFPEPKGGVDLGASSLEIDSNAIPSQPQDRAIPNAAPDYFPEGKATAPGTPSIPTPTMDPQTPSSEPNVLPKTNSTPAQAPQG